MKKISEVDNWFSGYFIKKPFPIWQRMGFHVTPNYFYEPVPDTRILKDELWSKPTNMVGVEINGVTQIDLLTLFSSKLKAEYVSFPQFKTSTSYQYYLNNDAFWPVDAEILYRMVRHFKSKRFYEVGSGNSTYLAAQAVRKNKEEGHECELIAFAPYPNAVLKAGFPGLAKVIPTFVQDIPLSKFCELTENGILFIDSTHVLKIGSDVQYEYLEILPRLKKGVLVHVHDIFLPSEYPQKWVLKNYLFWTEQYLLQAFLTFNNTFEVLWGEAICI